MTKTDTVDVILEKLQELMESEGIEAASPPHHETPLIGNGSFLDSLGLVNLLMEVEQAVQDRAGVSITLANEHALSRQQSPFRTPDTLAEYVLELLSAGANAAS